MFFGLGQQFIDVAHVIFTQLSNRSFEVHIADNGVVLRLRQIVLRLGINVLRVQHVNVDAHVQFVAQTVCFDGSARRFAGGF